MSHFTCTLHSYDSFDRVRVVVRVHDFDLPAGSNRTRLALDFSYLGVGQQDPVRWLLELLQELERQLRNYG